MSLAISNGSDKSIYIRVPALTKQAEGMIIMVARSDSPPSDIATYLSGSGSSVYEPRGV